MNRNILSAAIALAGVMPISLGGCVSLTQNYYTDNPQSKSTGPAGAQVASCGCPGTMPPYQAGGYYPQPNGGQPYNGQPYAGETGYPNGASQGYPAGYYPPDGIYHAPDVVYYPVPYYGGAAA